MIRQAKGRLFNIGLVLCTTEFNTQSSTYVIIEIEVGNVIVIVEDWIEGTECRTSRWARSDHARTGTQRCLTLRG
jgi:hypothetical protein